jgi:hypothetical protein
MLPIIACRLDEISVDDARLARARQNLARVDVIGITERFDRFVRALRDRFGWQLDETARLNAATEPTDEPARLRSRIIADNAYDIELFEQARELAVR